MDSSGDGEECPAVLGGMTFSEWFGALQGWVTAFSAAAIPTFYRWREKIKRKLLGRSWVSVS